MTRMRISELSFLKIVSITRFSTKASHGTQPSAGAALINQCQVLLKYICLRFVWTLSTVDQTAVDPRWHPVRQTCWLAHKHTAPGAHWLSPWFNLSAPRRLKSLTRGAVDSAHSLVTKLNFQAKQPMCEQDFFAFAARTCTSVVFSKLQPSTNTFGGQFKSKECDLRASSFKCSKTLSRRM